MKKDSGRFWRLHSSKFLGFIWPFYLFMIYQNLIYGLFISEIKDQNFLLDFFIFSKFKLGFKNKWTSSKLRVCKFVLQGVQNNFFIKILYILKKIRVRGSI